jgi:hypothetical protein
MWSRYHFAAFSCLTFVHTAHTLSCTTIPSFTPKPPRPNPGPLRRRRRPNSKPNTHHASSSGNSRAPFHWYARCPAVEVGLEPRWLHGKGGLRCHRARDRLESMHTSTAYRLTIRLATKQPSVRYRVSSTGRISLMRWAALRTQCRESSLLHTRTFCGDDYPRRCRSGSAPEPVPFLSPLPPLWVSRSTTICTSFGLHTRNDCSPTSISPGNVGGVSSISYERRGWGTFSLLTRLALLVSCPICAGGLLVPDSLRQARVTVSFRARHFR